MPLKTIFFLLLLTVTSVNAQEFSFRHYSIPEGLVQTQVMALHQDSKGFLWIGTKGGISRFDGEEFVNFTVKDGLADNLVHFFYENREGIIFTGLRSGIAIFKDGKLKNVSLPDSNLLKINFIYENLKGKTFLFFATKQTKIEVYEFSDNKFTKVDHLFKVFLALINTDTLVHSFSYDPATRKLWGSVNNRVFEMQDEKVRWIVQETDQIAGLKFRNKSLYFYTRKGIFAYKDQIKTKMEFPLNTAYLDTQSNNIFEIDIKGGVYFGNDRFQINYFDGNELITHSKEFYGSIAFFIDNEETVWIGGSAGDGLFCVENPAFVNYLPDKNGMPKNVWSIVEDKNGKMWFGGFNEGLVLMDEQGFARYGFPLSQKLNQSIFPGGILAKNGKALFTTNYEVFSWDGKDFAEFLSEDETWGAALIIFEDTINHQLLFGTGGGDLTIKYPDGEVEILKPTKPKNALSIVSLSMDEKNRYWIGYFRGMTIVDGEKYSVLPNEECDFNLVAICQYRDKLGTLWVSNEQGLYAIRGKSFRQVGAKIFPSTVTSLAAFDYLLKPVAHEMISELIKRFTTTTYHVLDQKLETLFNHFKNVQKIRINTREGFHLVAGNDLLYIKADTSYCTFYYCNQKTETISLNLGAIEVALPRNQFFRISRSHIINLDYLESVNRKTKTCTISRYTYSETIKVSGDRIKLLDLKVR